MRIVFDIEANNLLNHESVDYTSIPYKLKEEYKVHCIVAKDIDTGEVYAFYDGDDIRFEDIKYKRFELNDWKGFLKDVTQVVGHNIIDYDLPVVELYFGIQYEIGPDMLDGRSVRIDDTLVLSKLLNPDRFGGHSLDSWGRRVGLDKIKFGDGTEEQWETFTPEMLRYCIRDVEVNTRTLEALRKEWGSWKWNDAYQLEKKVAEIIFRQKHFGFKFDIELGEWCYDDLVEKMTAIEGRVEPLLPEKPISKTNAKDFCPPRQQFKKDGSMSSHMERFLEKHGGEVTEFDTAIKGVRKQVEIIQPKQVKIYNQLFNLPMDPDDPIVDKEPMKLSHQTEIKQHLMELGWVPTVWKEKDLSIDSSKRKLTGEKFEQAVERYVESTLGTPFEEARSEKLKCDPRELRRKLLDHNMNKPLKVYTSPSFTVDQDKNLCPNLINLGEKVAYVKEIVEWLTYRHRRNAIYSPAESSVSKTKDTGWLTNPRLEVDGRIPTPADTNGCNTARFQHRDVANVPRCSSLYGEYMRALFGAGEGYKQIGYDADGLEARIEGHYTMRYPGGKKYAESLVAEKPNDVHTQTKNKIIEITRIEDFTRDSAKTVKYACAYGAQPPKLASQNGWSMDIAKAVFNGYWEAAAPLASLKKAVTHYWKTTGEKKFIIGLDGRKLLTRSEHSLVNVLFQSAGVICMKRAMVILEDWLKKEDLTINVFRDTIEGKQYTLQMIAYHDEGQNAVTEGLVKTKTFEDEDSAKAWKASQEQKTGKILSDVGHIDDKHFVAYCRVGELAAKSITAGGEYYNLKVPLTAGYMVGNNWADCH